MKKNNFFLIVLSCLPAIAAFLIYYIYNHGNIFSDLGSHYDDKFIQAAKQILEKGFYSNNYYLPLYPYFLALIFKIFGTNLFYPIFFNIILHGLTALMLANISKNFNSKWFYPTLIIASCWPHLIWRTSYIYAETFFIFLMVSALFLLFNFLNKKRIIYLIGSSLFFGFSLITKGANVFLIFALPFFLFFIFKKKIKNSYLTSFKLVTIYTSIFVFVLSFQFLRVYNETGYFGYSYQTGNRLYSYIYPCLSNNFGCGKKDPNAVYKARNLFEKEKKLLGVNEINNIYQKDLIQKKVAINLIKQLEFSQIASSSIFGYLKLFFHNISYEVFERINIKALHLSDFTGNLYIKIKTMIIKIFKEDQFMIIWLMAQLLLVLSRVIQVLGILYFFNLKKKIYEFFLLLIFFIPTIFPVLSLGTIRYRAPLEPLLILLTIAGLYFLRNIIHKKSN